jgi:hypothetical protein
MVFRVKSGASLPISGQEVGAQAVIARAADIAIANIISDILLISANHPAHALHALARGQVLETTMAEDYLSLANVVVFRELPPRQKAQLPNYHL